MKIYEVWTSNENDDVEQRLVQQFSTRNKANKLLKEKRKLNDNPNRSYSLYLREID